MTAMSSDRMSSITENGPRLRFGLRSLLAVLTGFGFVSLSIRFLLRIGILPFDVAFLTVPWAVASLIGIAVAWRLKRSPVLGGFFGGVFGAVLSYGFDMLTCWNLLPWPADEVIFIVAWNVCCGSVLGGVVGGVREGISIRRRDNRDGRIDSSGDSGCPDGGCSPPA